MRRKEYRGYMGERRKALVDEVGYDVKHAAHCVRLLSMGIELAQTGQFNVHRPPGSATVLMGIKSGQWSLERVREYTEQLWLRFASVRDGHTLPEKPKMGMVEYVLRRAIQDGR